jgi:hypothetical protein
VSLFLSNAVIEELRAAQVQLNRHTGSSGDGRCLACSEDDPCAIRRAALRVFGRYGLLPRRWPGASRPDRVAESPAWSGWLRGISGAEHSSD